MLCNWIELDLLGELPSQREAVQDTSAPALAKGVR
jgi:hypothetical protein